ncbi:MAG: hypothetical protein ACNA7Q_03145 [Rhodobacterales bacterium]
MTSMGAEAYSAEGDHIATVGDVVAQVPLTEDQLRDMPEYQG